MANELILEARNVVKKYAEHTALDGVSVNVPTNSIFGLLGPNGAGKTTLIRIINRITAPDSGQLLFAGKEIAPDDVKNIGYLPEERGLYRKMKVGEQALYLSQLKGLSRHDALRELKKWFDKFDILPWWDKKVEELSKGMQQKVQFITTVLHRPKLLIFDEPFSGFDPINANLLKQEILNLRNEGATIIFSTHNMSSVEEICDEISLINASKVILSGHVDKIKTSFKTNTFSFTIKSEMEKSDVTLPEWVTVEENKTIKGHQRLSLKILNGHQPAELIRQVVNNHQVIAFEEVIPSMNDIFIRVVEEAGKNRKN
jgi:ABC-2 type transport system ATP-binding protein